METYLTIHLLFVFGGCQSSPAHAKWKILVSSRPRALVSKCYSVFYSTYSTAKKRGFNCHCLYTVKCDPFVSLQEWFLSLLWEVNFELIFRFNQCGLIVKCAPEASVLEHSVLSWEQAVRESLSGRSGLPLWELGFYSLSPLPAYFLLPNCLMFLKPCRLGHDELCSLKQ